VPVHGTCSIVQDLHYRAGPPIAVLAACPMLTLAAPCCCICTMHVSSDILCVAAPAQLGLHSTHMLLVRWVVPAALVSRPWNISAAQNCSAAVVDICSAGLSCYSVYGS
jgi:hypothetical protein